MAAKALTDRETSRRTSGRSRPTSDGTSPLLRVIGYARVSTDDQATGWGLAAQRVLMEQWCTAHGAELIALFIDVMSSRRVTRLIGREGAVEAVEAGAADALLVLRLDRVTRSVLDGAGLIERAKANGWRLLGVDGTDSADENQELGINLRIAVAQEERRLISRRTREGLERARAAGKRLGRESTVSEEVAGRIVAERESGSSYRAIAQGLDAAGIATPGGAECWRARAVRAIYLRMAEASA